MLKEYKKIYKAVLQPVKDNPEDISYRGKGLSNEYRLSFACGLTGTPEATSYTRIFKAPQEEVLPENA